MSRHRWWLCTVACAVACVTTAGRSAAQARTDCRTDTLAAPFPTSWVGTTIGQITVRARGVEAPNGALNWLANRTHVSTRLNVVLNELSFASGSALDSIEVLESVRRLRAAQLFSEVLLEGTHCGDGRTDLVIWTRDAFSLRANLRVSNSSNGRASLAEGNLFGTGRTISVQGESVDGRQSASITLADRALLDSRLRGAVQLRAYSDGRGWQWSIRSRDFSPRDVWRGTFVSSQVRRLGADSAAGELTDIDRRTNALAVSRLLSLTPQAAWALEAGVEQERVNVLALRPGATIGTTAVRREFVAPLVGLVRRSREFGTIDWLVPGQLTAELPVGIEFDAVVGVGRESNSRRNISHLDSWLGATAQPNSGTVLTGDVWSSGYWLGDTIVNGSLRFSGALYRRAARGMWIVRAASERLFNPDPDVFTLLTTDPTIRSLVPKARLAEQALSASIERSMHLYAQEGRWALDAALFTTWSERHRSLDGAASATNIDVVTVGVGFRRVRSQPTQAPLRLDIAHTVYRTSGIPSRWILVLSSLPWINGGRLRDGQRDITQR